MDDQVLYILIHCDACAAYPCKVTCKDGALAFFSGNVLIEKSKCVSCSKAVSGKNIPKCVAECPRSGEKRIIEVLDTEKKRRNAVLNGGL